jgi:HSP20 family protein
MFMRSLLPALVDRAVMRPERLVDSWLDGLFDDSFFAPVIAQEGAFSPVADLSETENDYIVRLEVPGIETKDISVEYLGDMLTVRGEKRSEHEEQKDGAHWKESRYGAFTRAFRLGKPVDAEKIVAELRNGVLTVTLPKTEDAKPRRIEVKRAEQETSSAPCSAASEAPAAALSSGA